MIPRRPLATGVLAAAVLLPPLLWLWPSLAGGLAPSFRDQGDFFYPLKIYTADRIRAGGIPLWNPLSGDGEPWLANGQSGVFYPPTLFFLIPSAALAAALFLLFHFAIAAWGTWRFLKEEGVSDAGALFGSLAYVGCGFTASLSAYWNHFGAWAYLPALACLARSGFRTRTSAVGFASLFGLQAMAGSPEISAATALVSALFFLAPRPEVSTGWVEVSARTRLLRFAGALLLGAAFAAWALLPMAELAARSDRRLPLPSAARESGSVTPGAFSSLLGTSTTSSGTFYLASLYAGPLLLFASLAAFLEGHRRKLVLLLVGIALAGILAASAGPPGTWLRAVPPLDRLRYPAKALLLPFFALAVLAGLGADSLRFRALRARSRLLLGLAGAAALAAAFLLPLTQTVRWATAAGILLLLVLLLIRLPASLAAAFEVAAALALAASLAIASRPLFRFVPEEEIGRQPPAISPLTRVSGRVLTPPMSDLARQVLENAGDDVRIVRRQREALLGYTNLLYGIPTVRTAAALPTEGAWRIAGAIDSAEDPLAVAGAANARVVWTPFRPARLPSKKVGEFFRAPLERYRPRVSFVRNYRVEPDRAQAWARAASSGTDRTEEVFLDREPAPRPSKAGKSLFLARLAEDRPERVVIEMTSNASGILVLADLDFPGWTAEKDGRKLPLLRADGLFRAVALPAGSHRVVFSFRPLSFYAGAALSASALGVILFLFLRGEPVPVGRRLAGR